MVERGNVVKNDNSNVIPTGSNTLELKYGGTAAGAGSRFIL